MAVVVIYDPVDSIVANRVVTYLSSANTPDYQGNPNTLVDPDLSELTSVPYKYWKYDGVSDVVEMSTSEKESVNAFLTKPVIQPVKVQEENPDLPTGGAFLATGLEHIVPSGAGVTTSNFSYTYPLAILSLEFTPTAAMEGDRITVKIAPETIIGAITADVSASDSTYTVQQSVIDNIRIGYLVHLDDGTNKDEVGKVTAIDTAGLTITVDGSATNAFAAATPTYVKISRCLLENLRLVGTAPCSLGASKIGASYLPAGTVMRFEYENVTTTAKTFSAIMECLY